jgi:hypothetical protein
MAEPPWDVPWEQLVLEDLRAFFAHAGDEGLTWEAKGTELIHRKEIRRHACGFANQLGGYLILVFLAEAAGAGRT